MKFNFRRFVRHLYITLFESEKRGVKLTPQRILILIVFMVVLAPIFLASAYVGWFLDSVFFPGSEKQRVREPVFIIGNMRSGTTFLHRLMARDRRNFIHFKTWELGFAPTITQRRLIQFIGRIDDVFGSPLQKLIRFVEKRTMGKVDLHPIGLQKAEEDDLILLYIWSSTFSLGVFPYPDEVLPYILPFDQLPEERERVMPFYKGCLKRHLYAHGIKKGRFLSKNPVFSSRVDALYETFPDGKFIYLIRNPFDVLGSLASYARMVWNDFQGAENPFPYDEYIWDTVKLWYRYTLARLEQADPDSYIIVRFDDLVGDTENTIRRIYEKFGFEINSDFEDVLRKAGERSRNYESKHEYSFENMAFTREQVLEEYQDLIERFEFDT